MTGANADGQLGINNTTPVIVWTQEHLGDTDWAFVECGYRFTVAIKTDGTLWVAGDNYYGQLGLGDHGAGTDRIVFTQIGSGTDWHQACAGGYHMLAVKNNGYMYATGRNNYGQLGLEDTADRDELAEITSDSIDNNSSLDIDNWLYVSCGMYHSLAFGSYTKDVEGPYIDEPQVWNMDF